ncbi:MAG: nucleoside-diphosphate sugar epimerase [Phototrophicales bacterium]|nr:MAG: nucleoside-diphosphate sugar epimerase [Phototrophicales bacterium]
MQAAITGGTGFVGSHIARLLIAEGHRVRVVHRATSRLDALDSLDYDGVVADILDEDALRPAFAGCEWVFHVAAIADYWRADKARMMEANVEGTRRVLRAAKDAGVARVVFTSSAAAVGTRADGQPADESDFFHDSAARFPYAYSKLLAEQVVQEAVQTGQDVVIVNPVVIFGPGDLNMISGSMLKEVKRFGRFTTVASGGIAVIDVRDVARGHLAAATKGRTGERYILGTQNIALRDLLPLVAEVVGVGRPIVYVPDFALSPIATAFGFARRLGINTPVDPNQIRMGSRHIYFDFTKMHTELGEPQISLRQSLEDTYRWYVEHGYL